jgi:DNA-binding SARP family transcriptional activator/tetratricopeptide (TPR) repeat protein
MRFRVLGPIQAWAGHQQVDLGTPQQRSVLAALLLEPGQLVTVARLVEMLWADSPPRTAVKNLQVHVHHLRRALAPVPDTQLLTVGAGYLLQVDDDQVDLHHFRRLVGQARTAPHPEAARLLGEALALWRGPALADAAGAALRNVAAALDEERLVAVEAQMETELRLGRHAERVAELGRLVTAYPLREQLRELLMLALFRCGRQAEALAAYRAGRQILRDELGIEPGDRLRHLHERILRADPALTAPARRPAAPAGQPVPAELPHDVRAFAGRRAELAELDALLAAAEDPAATASVIGVVDGLGGVGKTALVVHWAYRVRDHFPDGVLYLDMRGQHVSLAPLSTTEALGQMLLGLGLATTEIPAGEPERSRLLRTRMAEGRRLVVLDNAASAEQVRPLLPGTPTSLTVVTSRDRLSALVATDGAHRIAMRPLAAPEALALLGAALGAERLSAEGPAGAQLADLCSGLPLALRIAAANLATSPGRSIAVVVGELAGDRLGGLRVEGDEQVAIQSTFDLSYRALTPPARRLFCRLGAAPGVDFTAAAADAITGTAADAALRELSFAHLVEERTAGRFAMHDLVRAYSADRLDRDLGPDARNEASRRLLDWQLACARGAGARLHIPRLVIPPGAEPAANGSQFPTDAAAMTWLESERANIVAGVLDAARRDPRAQACQLAVELRGFFRLRRYVSDWIAVTSAALRVAEQLGDERAQAALHHSLGHANWSIGEYAEAIDHYKRTFALSDGSGWREGEASALSALGAVYHEMGQHDEAIASYQTALDSGALSPQMELMTVGSLGLVYQSVGRLPAAVDSFNRTLGIAEAQGLDDMAATSLGNLGLTHLELGDLAEAREFLGRALERYRQTGSRNGEANVRVGLATLGAQTAGYDDGAYQAALALRIARDIGDRRIECDALIAAAVVARRRGEVASARDRLTEAIEIADNVGYGRGLAPAVTELAAVELSLGDLPAASATAARALALARRAGHRPTEARALSVAAQIDLAGCHYDDAIRHGQDAVAACRELGLRIDLARSLYALDAALRATGGAPVRAEYRSEADSIWAALGLPARPVPA